jgi:hypothetical protein
MNGISKKQLQFVTFLINPPLLNIRLGAGAAGAASRYCSGSIQIQIAKRKLS